MSARGVLIALAISLVMWLFLWWMVSLTQRGFDRTAMETIVDVSLPKPPHPTTTTTVPPTTTSIRPAPVARTAPTVRTASVGRPAPAGEIADLIRSGFARFGAQVAEEAVRVAQCESHLDPRATNGQHASLFQISRTYHEARAGRLGFTWDRMWEPAVNIAVAADIYGEQRWKPWTCRYAA